MGTSIGYSPPSSSSGGSGNGGGNATYIGRDANFRNLNDTQSAVSSRVPLKIDGLKTQGAFNNLFSGLWNPETSRLHPSNTSQKFDCRIILEATPTVAGAVLTLDLDVSAEGAATPALIYSDSVELFKLEKSSITRVFPVYVSSTFLANGGKISVTCTDPVAISNASLYVRLVGGTA